MVNQSFINDDDKLTKNDLKEYNKDHKESADMVLQRGEYVSSVSTTFREFTPAAQMHDVIWVIGCCLKPGGDFGVKETLAQQSILFFLTFQDDIDIGDDDDHQQQEQKKPN
ncbi:hypothetical protein YC2023_073691 [Brassica napus]